METIRDIPVSQIDENPDNEKIFNMNDIEHLAQMIDSQGFRGAIEVMDTENGRYEIVAGHRRFRAYVSLGKTTIPCIISPKMTDAEKTRTLISSNINSRKMEPIDYARAIQYYNQKVCIPEGLNKEEECMRFFGISRTQYYRYLRILELNDRLLVYAETPNFPYTALVDSALPETTQNKIADILDQETTRYKDSNPALFSKNEVATIVERGKREKRETPIPFSMKIVPEQRRVEEVIEIPIEQEQPSKENAETLEIIDHITQQIEKVYDYLNETNDEEVRLALSSLKDLIASL